MVVITYQLEMQCRIFNYVFIYFTDNPSTADLLEQNGKTLTPTQAALLLTKKSSIRHHAVVNERQLEMAENNADVPSDSEKLLKQQNPKPSDSQKLLKQQNLPSDSQKKLLKQQNPPSDSQKLLTQQNPNSVNQDSMLVIPLKQSPGSLHRKHHWENKSKDSEILKKEDVSSNCAH